MQEGSPRSVAASHAESQRESGEGAQAARRGSSWLLRGQTSWPACWRGADAAGAACWASEAAVATGAEGWSALLVHRGRGGASEQHASTQLAAALPPPRISRLPCVRGAAAGHEAKGEAGNIRGNQKGLLLACLPGVPSRGQLRRLILRLQIQWPWDQPPSPVQPVRKQAEGRL